MIATTTPRTDGRRAVDAALAVHDLSVEFLTDDGWRTVVEDVSYEVRPGETLGIVGESGSGKSVTNLAVMGLLGRQGGRVRSGRALLDGLDLTTLPARELEDIRGDRISMVFQEPMTSLNPAFTVGNQIAETIRRHRSVSRRQAHRLAIDALSSVGIPEAARRARAYPHEFSGGMRQRVMIAMAVCCEPSVLIADEPTTALDVTIQAQILDLLRAMQAEHGMSIVFITHDLGVVADICDQVVVMYAGQVVERAEVHELYSAPAHPYTAALLASMPQMAGHRGGLSSIPGVAPHAGEAIPGCRFHPRCSHARAEGCATAEPALELLDGDRTVRCHHHRDLDLSLVP